MYAVVEITGKQYKVEKNKVVNVDKIKGHNSADFDVEKVLMVVDGETVQVGKPYLENVKVKASVLGDVRSKKVRGIKFKKRKNYTRTLGHRHHYTKIQIKDLSLA